MNVYVVLELIADVTEIIYVGIDEQKANETVKRIKNTPILQIWHDGKMIREEFPPTL